MLLVDTTMTKSLLLSCVQVARAFGGRIVIGVDISDKKLEMAKQMGATHTVNATKEDVPERIRVSLYTSRNHP